MALALMKPNIEDKDNPFFKKDKDNHRDVIELEVH